MAPAHKGYIEWPLYTGLTVFYIYEIINNH